MKRARRPWWHRVLLYGGLLVGFYVALCFFLAGAYLSPSRTHPALPRGFVDVQIPTGSFQTPAWSTPALAKGRPSKVVFVFAHGYGGDRSHWSTVARDLGLKGYESVILAMPAHDSSPIKSVGFGGAEARVLQQTFAWVRRKGDQPRIVVAGVSMGGAAAWLSSEFDPSIAGVVTEGAYARFDRAMSHWLDMAVPKGSVLLRPVVWIASARSGISPAMIAPEVAASKWRGRPALVLQGSKDSLIEDWHAQRLSQAASCELMIVKGAVHASCQAVLGARYAERLAEFAEDLSPAPPGSLPKTLESTIRM